MRLSGQPREAARLGAAPETREESGTSLSKLLGDVFRVLVPSLIWCCRPAGQTGAALWRGAQLHDMWDEPRGVT